MSSVGLEQFEADTKEFQKILNRQAILRGVSRNWGGLRAEEHAENKKLQARRKELEEKMEHATGSLRSTVWRLLNKWEPDATGEALKHARRIAAKYEGNHELVTR